MRRIPDSFTNTLGSKKHAAMFLLLLGFFTVMSFLSESYGTGSICLIYNTTGVPCPTCGMTRSYLALLHGDLSSAFLYHPLFFLVPVLFYAFLYQKKKLMIGLFFLFVLVYIYRMIVYFPHTEPMLYLRHSLWGRIINLLGKVF
jgi:hypothetical protein